EVLTQLAADSGVFTPISDLASKEQMASQDDMLSTVRNYYKIGDKTWSIPWNSSNPVLYYNKGLFKAAGLDPEKPPQTFDEMLADCKAIIAANTTLTACANWPVTSWFVEQWMAMQNAPLANNDNGRTKRATAMNFDSKEMLKIVSWWQQMAKNKYFTYTGKTEDYNGEAPAFLG